MDTIEMQLLLMVVLVFISAFFAAAETAFDKVNGALLKGKKDNKRAQRALVLLEDKKTLFMAILLIRIVVNVLAVMLSVMVFTYFFVGSGIIISTAVMIPVILIFCEIMPKSFARRYSQSFVLTMAGILGNVVWAVRPLCKLFMLFDQAVTSDGREEIAMTEDELKHIVEQIEQSGVINTDERDLIRSAIEFDDVCADDILTHRVDMMALDVKSSYEDIRSAFKEHEFSRMPVYRDTIDNIMGVIHEKDFFNAFESRQAFDIHKIIKEVLFVPETTKISDILKRLQHTKSHLCIVLDEYGGTLGLITLEDIIEELVGDIWDESDEVVTQFLKVDKNRYVVSSQASLEDLFDYLKITYDEKTLEDNTISGFVMRHIGKIPKLGDGFVYDKLKITVTKIDNRRILEILVEIIEEEKGNDVDSES